MLAGYFELKTMQLLLIFLPIALFLLAVLVIALLTVLNMLHAAAGKRQARDEDRRRRFRPDGQPYPPTAPGLCTRCGRVFDRIYYPPDGKGLCAECYGAGE